MSGKLKSSEGMAVVQDAVNDAIHASAAGAVRGIEQTVAGLKSGAEAVTGGQTQARQGMEQVQGQMRQGMEKAMKNAEQLVTLSQGNVEAVMKSGQILATGLQDISRQVAEAAQGQFEQSMAALRSFSGLRSFKEVVDLQSSLVRSAYESMVAESGRITERSMKLAEQASAPLTARIAVAMETFSARG